MFPQTSFELTSNSDAVMLSQTGMTGRITLQGTNISPKNGILSRWFSFSQGGICDRSREGIYGFVQLDILGSQLKNLNIAWDQAVELVSQPTIRWTKVVRLVFRWS